MTWKLPSFKNGIRVVEYYNPNPHGTRFRVDTPFGSFDLTTQEMNDDKAIERKASPHVTAKEVKAAHER